MAMKNTRSAVLRGPSDAGCGTKMEVSGHVPAWHRGFSFGHNSGTFRWPGNRLSDELFCHSNLCVDLVALGTPRSTLVLGGIGGDHRFASRADFILPLDHTLDSRGSRNTIRFFGFSIDLKDIELERKPI
jgi:hypothetical protein